MNNYLISVYPKLYCGLIWYWFNKPQLPTILVHFEDLETLLMTSKMCIVPRTWFVLLYLSLPQQNSHNFCIFRIAKNHRTTFGVLSTGALEHMPPATYPPPLSMLVMFGCTWACLCFLCSAYSVELLRATSIGCEHSAQGPLVAWFLLGTIQPNSFTPWKFSTNKRSFTVFTNLLSFLHQRNVPCGLGQSMMCSALMNYGTICILVSISGAAAVDFIVWFHVQ